MPCTHAQRDVAARRTLRLLWRHARFLPTGLGAAGRREKQAALARLFGGVNRWLAGSGAAYWINYGTLLGWHRARALLPHDRDVDFGAPVAAYEKLRAAAADLPRGFRLYDTSHRHYGPKLYVAHRGWEADIYFYADAGDRLRPLLRSREPGDQVPLPKAWIEPRQPATFLGETTFVPADHLKCLETFYGYIGPDAERDPVTRYYRPRLSRKPA